MRDLAKKFRRVPLLLKRISVVGTTDNFDSVGYEFPALSFPLGCHKWTKDINGSTGSQMLDRSIIRQGVLRDYLQVPETRAVVELDERKILRVPPGSHPTLHENFLSWRLASKSLYDPSSCYHRGQFAGRS